MYPKWRHHPKKESMIVWDRGVEESQTPDEDGWRDDRMFPVPLPIEDPETPKNPGRPKKVDA
jgi:hypothetical protein